MRKYLPWLSVLLLAACDDGGANPSDSGVPLDASAPHEDGSVLDASPPTPDANGPTPDAGHPTPDGGPSGEGDAEVTLPCNGHAALCERRFDEVVYATTHNAHAAHEYGYTERANQYSGLAKQLKDGVRAMMLDVYDYEGKHVLCHKDCAQASTLHADALALLKSFLEDNPREVFTIIYQDALGADQIAADLRAAGLEQLAYTYVPGTPWPTLAEMIAKNTRLVVTLERGTAPDGAPWLQNIYDLAWDTPWDVIFSCKLGRGKKEHSLFVLNHFMYTGEGLPSEPGSVAVNTFDVLYKQAKKCWDESKDVPNFLSIDFYESGDVFKVVDVLNGVARE